MTEVSTKLYCANHPDVETTLRCNRCEKLICPKCAVLTPTGYRCKECVRGQQKIFETAVWYDYPVIFVVVGLLAFVGSLIASYIGFFTIILAPVAGVVVAEAARLVVRRRRSKLLLQISAAAAVLGSLPIPLVSVLGMLIGFGTVSILLPLIWQGIYIFLMTSTMYYRLGGIQIG